jgi:hypothetical protein
MESLDYIRYRASFNNVLNEFLNLCEKLDIKYNEKIDNKYTIISYDKIIKQIKSKKENFINNQIKSLLVLKDINTINYLKITNDNINLLQEYDKFIELSNIIYNYDLLNVNNNTYKDLNKDVEYRYDCLVNLSNIKDHIIDDYSTD